MSNKWGHESVPAGPPPGTGKWGEEPVLSVSDDQDLSDASEALDAAAERLEEAGQAVAEAQEAVERATSEDLGRTDE